MCKYNSHYYWEGTLAGKRDVWQSHFDDKADPQQVLFVNTTLIDYPRKTLDNNWACYPDSKALLGFLLYIYVPLAFYFIMYEENEELLIPIASTQELLASIQQLNREDAAAMLSTIEELVSCWELNESACRTALQHFCRRFNETWYGGSTILHIGLFTSTQAIAQHILAEQEFPEVLAEDIGLTPRQLKELCEKFYSDTFIRKTFVKILNNKIGCII
ncbi:hypothetical protein [Sporomusa termitida]|uniref:Uncharacterized protein n=1 Tax=Sporomusa termitida TaxID=2377 RepID=A0A517DZG2_9FIRM|nr:hypothetical protein [Sporomusa termitida]QDR82739.1 hypothetical protein SPTER_41690 [Sporomusa termitida]